MLVILSFLDKKLTTRKGKLKIQLIEFTSSLVSFTISSKLPFWFSFIILNLKLTSLQWNLLLSWHFQHCLLSSLSFQSQYDNQSVRKKHWKLHSLWRYQKLHFKKPIQTEIIFVKSERNLYEITFQLSNHRGPIIINRRSKRSESTTFYRFEHHGSAGMGSSAGHERLSGVKKKV